MANVETLHSVQTLRFVPPQNFSWQARFYDHIIRDEPAYEKISHYILHNPAFWEDDKFNLP